MPIIKKILPFLVILVLLLIIKGNIQGILSAGNNAGTTRELTKQLQDQKKKNSYLKEKLAYVKTNQFVADQAQGKLGLLRDGEYFVIAPTPQPLNTASVIIDNTPNWQKWLHLFF